MTKDEFLMAVKLMINEDVSNRRFIHLKDGRSFDIVRFNKEEIILSSWEKYDGSKTKQSFPYDYLIENMVLKSDIVHVTSSGSGYTSLPTITF